MTQRAAQFADRVLSFEALDNFRDYGDYPAAHGTRLKKGQLYRSAHHGKATDADLARLAALDVAVVVDLRRKSERLRDPARRPPGFRALVIDNDLGDGGEAPHVSFVANNVLTPDRVVGFMIEEYRRLPVEPRHHDLYARYFQALATADGPVVIHCAAGKDRTGILAALTHHIAGVHPDDIMDDYLLTNSAARIEERAPEVARNLGMATGRTPSFEAVACFLGVRPEYLTTAEQVIKETYGSTDAYLAEVLGVTPALRDQLVKKLVG